VGRTLCLIVRASIPLDVEILSTFTYASSRARWEQVFRTWAVPLVAERPLDRPSPDMPKPATLGSEELLGYGLRHSDLLTSNVCESTLLPLRIASAARVRVGVPARRRQVQFNAASRIGRVR
jgi:hypothetical protein